MRFLNTTKVLDLTFAKKKRTRFSCPLRNKNYARFFSVITSAGYHADKAA
jgi:hypothetical protein